jgi:hypothetical protein
MTHIGDMSAAVAHLAASYVPARTRWTKLPVRRGKLRLRLDYQPDPHAHMIHVRHDPQDKTVDALRRGSYYGHIAVDLGCFYPHDTMPRQLEGKVIELLKEFATDPENI